MRVVPVAKQPAVLKRTSHPKPELESARQCQLERRLCPPQPLPSSWHFSVPKPARAPRPRTNNPVAPVMKLRQLDDSDRAALEAFLLTHRDSSMFLRSNARTAGLEPGTERYEEALWALVWTGALAVDDYVPPEVAARVPFGRLPYKLAPKALRLLEIA